MVLSLNALLRAACLPIETTILLRHGDGRAKDTLYRAAMAMDQRFEDYQRRQVSPNVIASFDTATHLVSFVVDHAGDTVFAGAWHMQGKSNEALPDPFVAPDPDEPPASIYRTKRVDLLDDLRGRLVIDWGKAFLKWCQRATQTKPILEIRRQIAEPPFPGYLQFRHRLAELETLPSSWLAALQATGGVYLLAHRQRAQFYVGSATGTDGFLGRWRCYRNGHAGNVGMQDIAGTVDDYDVSILETAGSGLGEQEVIRLEGCWKEKLGSRERGLNRN